MPNSITPSVTMESFVQDMTNRMTTLARVLAAWGTSEPHTLGALEQQVLRTIKELGNALLLGLAQLMAPAYPPPTVACACGHDAVFQRRRGATVTTILGPLTISRPYYSCAACHQGTVPLDTALGLCAGSTSAALDELLALLGATHDSFAAAATVLDKLTLVTVCPNTVRAATEALGAALHAHEQHLVETIQATTAPPPVRTPPAARMYVSMDGVQVHTRTERWKEVKLGSIYTTRAYIPRKRPDRVAVRTIAPSFVTDLTEAAAFGPLLWAEGAARGVHDATEVIVVGDGAHWIWNLAATYFPQATQVLDWYHASSYVWTAAHTIYGEGTPLATQWAKEQLDRLWDGGVATVITALQEHGGAGDGVEKTLTYFSEQQERMRYDAYRARGLQIGSGTIESGCKHVIGARLKQAGMRWSVDGAVAVGTVRAWLKSGRWAEAMALRAPKQRRYQRAGGAAGAGAQERTDSAVEASVAAAARMGAPVPQQVRAAEPPRMADGRPTAQHPWKKPWSVRRQKQEQAAQEQARIQAAAA